MASTRRPILRMSSPASAIIRHDVSAICCRGTGSWLRSRAPLGQASSPSDYLATIDNMSAPAAIDERRRDLVETVMVNSRIVQFSTPNHRCSCCHRLIVDACEACHTPADIFVGKRWGRGLLEERPYSALLHGSGRNLVESRTCGD